MKKGLGMTKKERIRSLEDSHERLRAEITALSLSLASLWSRTTKADPPKLEPTFELEVKPEVKKPKRARRR